MYISELAPSILLSLQYKVVTMRERITLFMRNVWSNTTIEPVIAIYYLIIALSGIVGEELYLKKACLVNFNNSAVVCDNIYAHKEIQVETQKYISGIQVTSKIFLVLVKIILLTFSQSVRLYKMYLASFLPCLPVLYPTLMEENL